MNNTNTPTTASTESIATITNALLEDLFNPSISTLDLCNFHDLSLPQLAAVLESETFADARAAFERINAAHQSILTQESRTLALARLSDQLKDRPESPAHAESQRKAATKILSTTQPKTQAKAKAAAKPNRVPRLDRPRQAVSSAPQSPTASPAPAGEVSNTVRRRGPLLSLPPIYEKPAIGSHRPPNPHKPQHPNQSNPSHDLNPPHLKSSPISGRYRSMARKPKPTKAKSSPKGKRASGPSTDADDQQPDHIASAGVLSASGALLTNDGLAAKVLVLNRNYLASRVVSAKRAFVLLARQAAEVIHADDGSYANYDLGSWAQLSELQKEYEPDSYDWVRTVRFDIAVPRIIRLTGYDKLPKQTVKLNRRNIFARDRHTCQYCGHRFPTTELSIDHVVPRTQSGPDTWTNLVCSCVRCNSRKGGRTPSQANMHLIRKPIQPKRNPLISVRLTNEKYASWKAFLDEAYWSVELR